MTQQPHDAYADLAPSVGDRLRIARERRAKLSQGDFADLVNASRGTVSNYERGWPSSDRLQDALAVTGGKLAVGEWHEVVLSKP